MIDKISGKVAYAVMSFGGFLGMGDSYHPLPWHVLTYDTGQGGYVVDLDRSKLERRLSARTNAGVERSPLGPAGAHDYYARVRTGCRGAHEAAGEGPLLLSLTASPPRTPRRMIASDTADWHQAAALVAAAKCVPDHGSGSRRVAGHAPSRPRWHKGRDKTLPLQSRRTPDRPAKIASAGLGRETDMSHHVLITGAIMLAITGPAFADCNQEVRASTRR